MLKKGMLKETRREERRKVERKMDAISATQSRLP